MPAPCDEIRAMRAASSVKSPWSERIRNSGLERKVEYVIHFDPRGVDRALLRPVRCMQKRRGRDSLDRILTAGYKS